MPQKRIEKRTYADRAEYMKAAVVKRRRKVRDMAIAYGGGQCVICGYKKCSLALSLDHGKRQKQSLINVCSFVQTATWKSMTA